MTPLQNSSRTTFPLHGWLGAALVLVFWTLNWTLSGEFAFTAYGFFPLWLGYALVVDALVHYRTGTSLLTRSRRGYAGLFLVSAPAWWLFELLNWRVMNWLYLGRDLFTDLEYAFLSTWSFSTVLPAVFGTAELIASFPRVRRLGKWIVVRPDRRTGMRFFGAGVVMLGLLLAFPDLFFPLLWISVYCLLAPLNIWLGNRVLGERTQYGDWRPVIALFLGSLICGFFWEFWNFYAFPKWIYTIPWADFLHVFEMPLLGYGGYLPFALELFAIYHLLVGLLGWKQTDYITAGLFPDDSQP